MDSFNHEYIKKYHFFLSELLAGIREEERGLIIELMRGASNVNDMIRLTSSLNSPSNDSNEDQEIFLASIDSTIIFTINLNAAQLREILKLFGNFARKELYIEFRKSLKPIKIQVLKRLEEVVNNYNSPGNYMHDVLIPLRNIVFHYNYKKANEWVVRRIHDESLDSVK